VRNLVVIVSKSKQKHYVSIAIYKTCGDGVIAPEVFKVGTTARSVASVAPWPLYSRQRKLPTYYMGKSGCFSRQFWKILRREKIPLLVENTTNIPRLSSPVT